MEGAVTPAQHYARKTLRAVRDLCVIAEQVPTAEADRARHWAEAMAELLCEELGVDTAAARIVDDMDPVLSSERDNRESA